MTMIGQFIFLFFYSPIGLLPNALNYCYLNIYWLLSTGDIRRCCVLVRRGVGSC